jgi:putative two-component system response regulator
MIQTDLSPHLPSRQPVVLFVDDDHRILRGVERLFRQAHVPWGYAFAGGADEALALLADREVDAMISDVRMPGRDGFELLSQLRNSAAWADLPIVMLTGINDPGLKNRALDLGATDLLNKPVNPDDLFARIRSVLQLKRYQDIIKCQNSHLEELVRRRTESLAATRLEMAAEIAGCHHE